MFFSSFKLSIIKPKIVQQDVVVSTNVIAISIYTQLNIVNVALLLLCGQSANNGALES